jgi:hypothetical protein
MRYEDLPHASPQQLHRKPISGQWRQTQHRLEARHFGGAWHPIQSAQQAPGRLLLVNGMVLAPDFPHLQPSPKTSSPGT